MGSDQRALTVPQDTAGSLAGKTCLVTGAGNGLGRAIALQLAHAGARLILTARDREKLVSVAVEAGGSTRVAVCDISSEESIEHLIGELAGETIDVLVNNAGVPVPWPR